MLVTAFVDHYKKTCTRLLVGTQAANIPSMRLYEELGFSVVQTKCVFHMHAAPVGVVGAAAAGR